jgi:hypothetical protein
MGRSPTANPTGVIVLTSSVARRMSATAMSAVAWGGRAQRVRLSPRPDAQRRKQARDQHDGERPKAEREEAEAGGATL